MPPSPSLSRPVLSPLRRGNLGFSVQIRRSAKRESSRAPPAPWRLPLSLLNHPCFGPWPPRPAGNVPRESPPWRPAGRPDRRAEAMLMPSREGRVCDGGRKARSVGAGIQEKPAGGDIKHPSRQSVGPAPRGRFLTQQLPLQHGGEAAPLRQPLHAPACRFPARASPGGGVPTSSRASSLAGLAVWGKTLHRPPSSAALAAAKKLVLELGPRAWPATGTETPVRRSCSRGGAPGHGQPPSPQWPKRSKAPRPTKQQHPARLQGRLAPLPPGGSLGTGNRRRAAAVPVRAINWPGAGGAEHRESARSACLALPARLARRPLHGPKQALAGCPGPSGRRTARQQHQGPVLVWPGAGVRAGKESHHH